MLHKIFLGILSAQAIAKSFCSLFANMTISTECVGNCEPPGCCDPCSRLQNKQHESQQNYAPFLSVPCTSFLAAACGIRDEPDAAKEPDLTVTTSKLEHDRPATLPKPKEEGPRSCIVCWNPFAAYTFHAPYTSTHAYVYIHIYIFVYIYTHMYLLYLIAVNKQTHEKNIYAYVRF